MHKAVTGRVEAKKLLSRRRQSNYRWLQNIYACTGLPVYLWCWKKHACRLCVGIAWAQHKNQSPVAAKFAEKKWTHQI